jgi:hypothetical protein
MTEKPFRIRAKNATKQAIKLRLFLLKHGKSMNGITYDQCTNISQEMESFRSDRQYAKLLSIQGDLILNCIPSSQPRLVYNMRKLIYEANSILQQDDKI